MNKDGLVNCKKCGTLFFKTSGRDICEECFKKELVVIDNIRNYIVSTKRNNVTVDEIETGTGIQKDEIEDLISRGRLFALLPKISIKCRFCGAELEDDEKSGFTCKKCLLKFSPKVNELEKKGMKITKQEEEAKKLNRRLRGSISSPEGGNRFGFIKNYDL